MTPPPRRDERAQALEELLSICSTYKPDTVRRVFQESKFNKTEALNRLFDMEPDNEEEDFSKELQKMEELETRDSGDTSGPANETANNLMNEVFETLMREEINGREFEELFEEIAEMIKEDQREMGMGVLEINSFVDECNSIKKMLLVGFREELTNFDDFHFDESHPLIMQTQEFLEERIKKQAQMDKVRENDFPSLGGDDRKGRNIVDRIAQEKRRKKEEESFFTPARNTLPQFARERNNQLSIFNVDNRLKSEKDLLSLHKEFSDVPILDLKFVYKTFVGDYNVCREFLIKYYHSKRSVRVYEVNPSPRHPQPLSKKVYASRLSKEEVDEELKHLSLDQLRDEIDHLYKLKQALQLTKMKIKGSNQKLELDRLINEKLPLIRKLSHAARLLQVDQMMRANPLYVDLHGYREEEIDPLLQRISDMIRSEFHNGSDKIRPKRVKGQASACLTVMTGKGIHSKGNRSILKPTVKEWCEERGYEFEEEEDHLKVYVGLE